MMSGEHIERVERKNLEDKLGMEQHATELRKQMIESAFLAVKNYWAAQEESFDRIAVGGYDADATYDYYICPSFTGFPQRQSGPQLALSVLLKPAGVPKDEDEAESEVEPDLSEMTVFVPIPNETITDADLIVEELPLPERIAVRYVSPTGLVINYEISEDGMYPFVNALESGDETVEEDGLVEEIAEFLADPEDTRIKIQQDVEVIPKLFKDMVEWRAQVQKRLPVNPNPPAEPAA